MVFLQALKHCKKEIAELHTLEEVDRYAECFPRFFTTIAERWPAASHCLQEYERMWAPIREEFCDFLSIPATDVLYDSTTSDALPLNESQQEILVDTENAGFSDLWPMFNPSTYATEHAFVNPSVVVPHDWNTEFDLGMMDYELC